MTGHAWSIFDTSNSLLPANCIYAFAINDSGNVLIGTANGLARCNATTLLIDTMFSSTLSGRSVHALGIDDSNNLWTGTDNGLVEFNGAAVRSFPSTSNSGLPGNIIYSIAVDRTGTRWFGTDGGLASFDGNNWASYDTANSRLKSNHVYAVAAGQQREHMGRGPTAGWRNSPAPTGHSTIRQLRPGSRVIISGLSPLTAAENCG